MANLKITAVNGRAEIFLYGYIGFEITAGDFMRELRRLEDTYPVICIRINSQGGEMFQGFPIYNAIKSSKANIEIYVDGLAASMASAIMMAGKKVSAASNARIMIHGPQGGDYTTVENLQAIVDMMKTLRTDLAKIYASKTGKAEQWVMDNWLTDGKDHWFTAQEAKDAGLIDEIYNVDAESPSASWELPRIAAFYNEKLPLDNNSLNKTEPSMKKIIAVLTGSKLVTLPETATEELVAESTQAVVNQLTQRDQTIAQKDQALAQKDAEITRLTAELTTQKTAGLKKNAEALVAAAVTAGKIVAAQKDNFEKLAGASEDGYSQVKALFDSMQPYKSIGSQLTVTPTSQAAPGVYASLKDEFEKRAADSTLEALKAENPEHFKAVYKAGTGKDFKA